MNATITDDTRDFGRLFVGNRQITVTHFYGVGKDRKERKQFAYGYFTPDDVFHQGIVAWDAGDSEFVAAKTEVVDSKKASSMAQLYWVGKDPDGRDKFAYGYFTPDDVFHQGVVVWDDEEKEFITNLTP